MACLGRKYIRGCQQRLLDPAEWLGLYGEAACSQVHLGLRPDSNALGSHHGGIDRLLRSKAGSASGASADLLAPLLCLSCSWLAATCAAFSSCAAQAPLEGGPGWMCLEKPTLHHGQQEEEKVAASW